MIQDVRVILTHLVSTKITQFSYVSDKLFEMIFCLYKVLKMIKVGDQKL